MGSTGLTASGWRWTWPEGQRRRVVAIAVALLVIAGGAVAFIDGGLNRPAPGLAGGEAGTGSGGAPLMDEQAATGEAADAATPAPRSAHPLGQTPPPPAVPGSEPRVVKHAEMSIEVAEGSVTGAFDRVADVARSRGGFVVSSSTSTFGGGAAGAELTLRVPAESFDAARADLAGLGEVRSVQVGGEDVTAQLVDLDARLRALRAEEDALTALLGEAGNVGEVLAVREQVSVTRLEIEQLAAQQASLDDRATFSTLRVSLSEPGTAFAGPEPEPATGLARSFERALDGAVAVAGGMVVVVGYLLPVMVLGLLAWGTQRLIRLRIRRRPA